MGDSLSYLDQTKPKSLFELFKRVIVNFGGYFCCVHIFSAKLFICSQTFVNCWFSHDVTKFQTSELLILLRFYSHDVLEQLKTNIQTNFHSAWVLGLV